MEAELGHPQPAGVPDEAARGVRILLVDDRVENLIALEAILGSLDHELVRAQSGEEALKALLTAEFAVILLDASMPGMDGFETAARIKRRERTRDIPILFLTAHDNEPQHAFRGYEVGAVDYLTKPFDPWILRAKVSVFVHLHLTNRRLKEQAALLRQQLTAVGDAAGGSAAGGSGAFLVGELSNRLGAVEEQVGVLIANCSVHPDSDTAAALTELVRRTNHLREAVSALGARSPSRTP
jgi:CheY-like chemotaxis protein